MTYGPIIEKQARVKLDEMVDWLIEQGFPWDWNTTIPAPAFLLDELAVRFGDDWGSTGQAADALREVQPFKERESV